MATFTKFLCLSLCILLFAFGLAADEKLRFKGDYFIYSDDFNYIYGGGNIVMTGHGMELKGDALYMEIGTTSGILYGNVTVKQLKKPKKKAKTKQPAPGTYNAVYFKGIPTSWLTVSYGEKVKTEGASYLAPYYIHFAKHSPAKLEKESSLYFEFREFWINNNRRIKARYVIPYAMGVATMPLRSFTVRRGAWAEKTLVAFQNFNYSAVNGLAVKFYLRTRESFFKGDHKVYLSERSIFGLDGAKRGIRFSGGGNIMVKKKKFMAITNMWNSVEQTYNVRLSHVKDSKLFRYSISQDISGRKDLATFFQLRTDLTYKGIKFIKPRVDLSHDWKKSFAYKFSTPLNLWKKLSLNFSWGRRIIRDTYRSDTTDFATSMGFNGKLFNLSSNYNYTTNLVEDTVRQNFSANVGLKPIYFLHENVHFDISTFCNFSSIPSGDETLTRFSPGLNIAVRSAGARLPLGFKLVPGFTFNHLWDSDKQKQTFSDFNYSLSLQKEIGPFLGSIDYNLASRYRARGFWLEGNNRRSMNVSLNYKHRDIHSILMRFYFNNAMALETISLTGQITLPWDLRFSSFVLYYYREDQFRTTEIFLEKTFRKRIKIQGGYSLALKRFFIKFITM